MFVLDCKYSGGDEPVLLELRTASGEIYMRDDARSPWQCFAGCRIGEQFDEIEYHFERVQDGALLGCADVNLVGLDLGR